MKKTGKKVLIVEPAATINVFNRYMSIPRLGPVILATMASQAGYDASVHNENISGEISDERLAGFDWLGLSCTTSTYPRATKIGRRHKKLRPDAKRAIGGIHVSMIPEVVAAEDIEEAFDYIIAGEAEEIFLDLLAGNIKDRIVYAPRPQNLDTIVSPDFSLIRDYERFRKRKTVMETSRGCKHACTFCSVTKMFGTEYRTKSLEKIKKEIEKSEGRNLFFSDDNFVEDPDRTNQILEMMIANEFNIPWSAQLRAEVAIKNPELVKKMSRAGCRIVYVGLESVNPQSLKEMKKGQTVEDITKALGVFDDNGIDVLGMFVLGNDSDDLDIFPRTSDFCEKNRIPYAQFLISTPVPQTALYSKLEKQGRLLHKKWDFFDGLHVVFRPARMTPEELQEGTLQCFRKFYSYSNAMRELCEFLSDSANYTIDRVSNAIMKTYTDAKQHFPSFYPTFMRAAGRKILEDWLRGETNISYSEYLHNISNPALERA